MADFPFKIFIVGYTSRFWRIIKGENCFFNSRTPGPFSGGSMMIHLVGGFFRRRLFSPPFSLILLWILINWNLN